MFQDPGKMDTPEKRPRWGEPRKFVPVIFVVLTILYLFVAYITFHCIPMFQLHAAVIDYDMRFRGIVEFVVFMYVTILLLICYVRCMLEHPGEIPSGDPQWEYIPQDGRVSADWFPGGLQETKKTGERRHCKWCGKYKPDRCHHCRTCRICILKMDHHCPWIYNCVGFGNYKFFFLLLVYTMLDTHLIVWTMAESVKRCIMEPIKTPFATMFLTFFTVTLAFFLAVLVTGFLGFHIKLGSRAMTTIEHCEKSKKGDSREGTESSAYDLGPLGNIRAILGNSMLLWFFPCSRPVGDGLTFISDETRLTKDLESGQGIRLRTHQKTQRYPRQQHTGPGLGSGY